MKLSSKQIKMFADMYAEKESIELQIVLEHDCSAKYDVSLSDERRKVYFNDLNIVMGLLEWWEKQDEYNAYEITRGYVRLLYGNFMKINDRKDKSKSLVIAIAEALTEVKG